MSFRSLTGFLSQNYVRHAVTWLFVLGALQIFYALYFFDMIGEFETRGGGDFNWKNFRVLPPDQVSRLIFLYLSAGVLVSAAIGILGVVSKNSAATGVSIVTGLIPAAGYGWAAVVTARHLGWM